MKHKVILGTTALLGLCFYFFLNQRLSIGIPCLFYQITGFYCPGCGVTRMLFALLKLDFYQAFRYNPFVFLLIIFYLLYKILNIKYPVKINSYVIYGIVLLAILFGVLRNIEMFYYLKPTVI